jgi:hypothetical protein
MATLQHNITSILTKDLLTAGDRVNSISSITLANVDTSNDAEVDLFLNKGDDNFYILKDVSIPRKNTLVLYPDDGIVFNNNANGFSMRIQVDNGSGAATAVDVIIRK